MKNNLKASEINMEQLIPEKIIQAFLFSWFLSSGILIYLNKNNQDYLSLTFSGFNGLITLILLISILFAAIFLSDELIKKHFNLTESIIPVLASLSFLFFSYNLLAKSGEAYMPFGLIALTILNLILNRRIVIKGLKNKNVLNLLYLVLNLLFIATCVSKIPFSQVILDISASSVVRRTDLYNYSMSFALIIVLLLIVLTLIISSIQKRMGNFLGDDSKNKNLWYFIFLCIVVLGFQSFLVGRILHARYQGLMTTTYDFNLFVQMFHSMNRDLSQMTTLERNMPLSHFGVHISPVYYLMLPIFKLFPDPSTLQIMQAVIVASGVIPALLLARHFKLSETIQGIIGFIFMMSPAFIVSNFYDLHENCFLVPFILWTMYFIETKRNKLTYLFILLTLFVKEDAALYIWAIALFLVLDRREVKKGIIIFILSSLYFLGTAILLKNTGEGPMTGRFTNMMSEPSLSLLSVILTIFRNPGYVLQEIFTHNKLVYLLTIFLPLGGLPLINRRYSLYSLMVPLLVMNLLSDYPYQADIKFQYNYGSSALLFYLAILTLKELDMESLKSKSLAFLLATALVFSSIISIHYLKDYEIFPSLYEERKETTDKMKKIMDTIPQNASVLATPYLTGYLANRKIIYDVEYNFNNGNYTKTDYIVVDFRYHELTTELKEFLEQILKDGYKEKDSIPNLISIFKKE